MRPEGPKIEAEGRERGWGFPLFSALGASPDTFVDHLKKMKNLLFHLESIIVHLVMPYDIFSIRD